MGVHTEVSRGKDIMSSPDTKWFRKELHIHVCICKERKR